VRGGGLGGTSTLAKLPNDDTDGKIAIFQENVLPMSGPPLHRHSREDEWFSVVEGQMTVQIDGQQFILRTGGSAFAPRGTAHTFQNFGPAGARVLVLFTPGYFQQFFEELSSLIKVQPTLEHVRVEQLMNKYGVEVLGRPLS
jgi:mannose-6-phosphate isomerase-like protein (cupin superfamily)